MGDGAPDGAAARPPDRASAGAGGGSPAGPTEATAAANDGDPADSAPAAGTPRQGGRVWLPRSLTVRLALATALWVAVGLAAAWVQVSGLVVQQLRESFDSRSIALLDQVIAAAGLDANGDPVLTHPIAEPRFEQPLSGTYWQITAAPDRVAASRSLWDQRLPVVRGHGFALQTKDVAGPRHQRLRVLEREIVLPDAAQPLHVQVAVARDALDREISFLRRSLAMTFVVIGMGLVAVVVATVSIGLRPLRRLRRAVASLRSGRRTELRVAVPREVEPLVAEIDALVRQNRATVDRARNHVGNLAHALRTRLAVLRNALDGGSAADLALAARELEAADHIVQHHLARARAAALAGAAGSRTEVRPVAEEIAAALRRLQAGSTVAIVVDGPATLAVRCERQDLAEMIGNLMENACKWAQGRVGLQIAAAAPNQVAVTVTDDGPGLPAAQLAEAQARGARFDEEKPGSGLGLAIVADLARLYDGALALDRAAEGGLLARLTLPAA
ncbi:MAG: sensor histidine kinase [Rhodospirillales bacterium]|nr:sensor histidine kinase [Rhodospirillales bacterium]